MGIIAAPKEFQTILNLHSNMAQIQFKKDQIYGDWKIQKSISGGGNGAIWTAINSAGDEKVIKLLKKTHSTAKRRFLDEISIMIANKEHEGVVTILDHSDLTMSTDILWYVMDRGILVQENLARAEPIEIVECIINVVETLVFLHSKGVSHRDLKPQNLLLIHGNYVIGDFGLVDYPLKEEGLTLSKNPLGPRWTIAPEMRNNPESSDGLKADVYSIAKTLWILLTGVQKGFEGQYNPTGSIGLIHYQSSMYLNIIEDLLISATENDPDSRPNMNEFLEQLYYWVECNNDFLEKNKLDWAIIQQKLFPTIIPERVIWEEIESIIAILNIIGGISNLNHMMFPDGGGFDLRGAKHSNEPGCIELDFGLKYIIKPNRLIFEGFNDELEWNYLRLETENLEPVFKATGRNSETVTEVAPSEYKPYDYADNYYYQYGKELKNARSITRVFGGSFVIFQKTSSYNWTPETYDGRHEKVDAEGFRRYIQSVINHGYKVIKVKEEGDEYPHKAYINHPMPSIEGFV